jgi:hypothetical protein
MALIRSDLTIFRLGRSGSEIPLLPTTGGGEAVKSSLGRTSAEVPREPRVTNVGTSAPAPVETTSQ